jgi:DNA-binding transcriptional LysR family regulator
MARRLPPLNGLRAFEAAARQLSFTRAAEELHVTQAAVAHQVKGLEAWLGTKLFRRLPRALLLTDEGQALLPELKDAFDRMSHAIDRLSSARAGGTLVVSALTTFVLTWLVPRLPRFQEAHPTIEVRLLTSARLVDFAREDVDVAIRYGTGYWPGLRVEKLFDDVLTPLCGRAFRERLREPADLRRVTLLQTTGDEDWPIWLRAAGVTGIDETKGPLFDSTKIAVQAAIDGLGVAIGAPKLFADDVAAGRLFQPFPLAVGNGKAYWTVAPENSADRPKVQAFRDWICAEAAAA